MREFIPSICVEIYEMPPLCAVDYIRLIFAYTGLHVSPDQKVFERITHLETPKCPFANLPELAAGRWDQGLTAEKMKDYVWLRPEVVAQIQFLEWTGADHLRHTKFVGLREDKDPSKVVREI
jgi:ATP dependent DNA ligase C terminal region